MRPQAGVFIMCSALYAFSLLIGGCSSSSDDKPAPKSSTESATTSPTKSTADIASDITARTIGSTEDIKAALLADLIAWRRAHPVNGPKSNPSATGPVPGSVYLAELGNYEYAYAGFVPAQNTPQIDYDAWFYRARGGAEAVDTKWHTALASFHGDIGPLCLAPAQLSKLWKWNFTLEQCGGKPGIVSTLDGDAMCELAAKGSTCTARKGARSQYLGRLMITPQTLPYGLATKVAAPGGTWSCTFYPDKGQCSGPDGVTAWKH